MSIGKMKAGLAGLMSLGLAGSVMAAPVTFFGEDLHSDASTRLASTPNSDAAANSFLSQLSGTGTGTGTESFESFADNSTPTTLTFPSSSGSITATLSNGTVQEEASGTNGAGRYPVTGTKFLSTDANDFTIDFSSDVAAFGFFGVDIGDFGGELMLELSNGGTETVAVGNTPGSSGSTDGSVLFFGVQNASSPFTSVTFNNSSGGSDVFAFDDMTIGDPGQIDPNPVPTPSSLALLGLALAGLGASRRKK